MKRRIFLAIVIAGCTLSVSSGVAADEPIGKFVDKVLPFENLEIVGYFRNETALKVSNGMDEFMKEKNIMDIKANYRFTDWLEAFTEIKLWYDATYDIEGRYKDLTYKEKNQKLTMPIKTEWIREAYLDIYTPNLDIRAGKQQVVWGTTDGVRILDMVNPLDYREWTIKDYSETRIPLWMFNLEGQVMMNGHLQVLIIPDYEPNYYAPAGSPFALRTVVAGAESSASPFVTVTTIDERPERKFENMKYGLRWRNVVESGVLSGLQYSINYLHTYDFASSAYTKTNVLFSPFGPPQITVQLTRRAEQIEVIGGSFAKTITEGIVGSLGKGWTVRGEFAHIHNGAMNYGTDKSIEGTVDVDQYNYAIGLDKTFFSKLDFSFQFIQLIASAKEDYDETDYTLLFGPTRGPLDNYENILTMFLATDFMHERLKPQVLIIYTDDNDWRISPKVSFEVNDNWMVTAGLHIFEGHPQHLNGQFDKNDQIFFETQYSW